jgi:hypothetical protein
MAQTKPKYRLLNKWGNRVEYTDSEVEKNILLDRGFHIDENWGKEESVSPKNPTPRKRKVANKNEGQLEN